MNLSKGCRFHFETERFRSNLQNDFCREIPSPHFSLSYFFSTEGTHPGLPGDLGSFGGKEGRREARNGKKVGSKELRETNGQRWPTPHVRRGKAEGAGSRRLQLPATRGRRRPRGAAHVAAAAPSEAPQPGHAFPFSLNGRRARPRLPGPAPFICITKAALAAIGCWRAGSSVTSALAG